MKNQFKFLFILMLFLSSNNNISASDNNLGDADAQEINAAAILFRPTAVEIANASVRLSATHWRKILNDTISICVAHGIDPANIPKLNKVMLTEGIKFRNNCRLLATDQMAAEKKIAKAEVAGIFAEGIRLAAHREIAACNPVLTPEKYRSVVAYAAMAHDISVAAHVDITAAHRELDHVVLHRQHEISEFSHIVAVAALKSYKTK